MTRAGGITVVCVYCKDKRVLSWDEAAKVKDVVLCEKDGGPMVVQSADYRAQKRSRK